ncbi:hypothetical protein [Dinghuibacter silviterrae]|nr:hypothetical protein [Dinghuibacter silviterrae]
MAQSHFPLFLSGDITLDSLTRLVHRTSDIRFSFDARKIRSDQVIHFYAGRYSLNCLLVAIRGATDLTFVRYREHIIFRHKHPGLTGVNTAGFAAPSADETGEAPPAEAGADPEVAAAFQPVLSSPTPAEGAPAKVGGHHSTGGGLRLFGSWNLFKGHSWYAGLDLGMSTAMFLNPHLEAGFRRLYLIAGWQTNGPLSGWAAGLGSIVFERDRGLLRVSVTAGPVFDSMDRERGLTLRDMLYSVSATWSERFGKHWALGVGLDFSYLKTEFQDQEGTIKSPVQILNVSAPYSIYKAAWIGPSLSIDYLLHP